MKKTLVVDLLILITFANEPPLAAALNPNIVLFVVDDLGWNGVSYHASKVNNTEVYTPNIDRHVSEGIEMDRGYMTPWCGPSRAALLTGRTNSYNPNITNNIWDHKFDDDIGFVGGLLPGTKTIAHALKEHANYTAYYSGKWGIGGGAWSNTPVGMGFDKFVGFWGDSLETCDGWHSYTAIPPFVPLPTDPRRAPAFVQTMPGYWEQTPQGDDNRWCGYFREQANIGLLSEEEANIGCKTQPRKVNKLLDEEFLEDVLENIQTHDYESGPLLQVHAPQLIHSPMNYPKAFDNNPNQPGHFYPGEAKPIAQNEDHRWALNNAMTYLDDIFGRVMQTLKDEGQWENTIVLFTSDNGGAVYYANAGNNYPLRGAKFSGFDGGIRVPQFLSGGFINNLPNGRSDTFMFPQDWAPTLLEMAGADSSLLLGENAESNGPYGSSMYEYIQRSLQPDSQYVSAQKLRKASLSYYFFFEVAQSGTMKMLYSGDGAILSPRKWAPVWPQNGDYLPTQNDLSIRPCRPDGVALECCYTDVWNDPQEDEPLMVDCTAMNLEAKKLYTIEGGCEEWSNKTSMCLEPDSVQQGVLPEETALWTQMGSPGPWLNAVGQAVKEDLSVACICQQIDTGVNISTVDGFTATIFSPFECHSSASEADAKAIPCDGNLTIEPRVTDLESFAEEGFDVDAFAQVMQAEQERKLAFNMPLLFTTVLSYVKREGHTEWPNLGKYPNNAMGLDTCVEKEATPVPIPLMMIHPWMFSVLYEFKTPAKQLTTLCVRHTLAHQYCPSKQNALQKGLDNWDYSESPPVGTFADGSTWEALRSLQCKRQCKGDYKGTAYIKAGNDNWGLTVTADDSSTLDDSSTGVEGISGGSLVPLPTASFMSLAIACLFWL